MSQQQQAGTQADRALVDPLEATIAATDKAIAQRTDLLMAKIDNDSMMAECRSRPRNLADIKAYMSEQLKEFPQIAIDCIYEKPVGKDPGTGEMKYATGLSIRAAEMLAEAYGFNKISVEVTPLPNDPNRVRVEAKFSDFQTCRVWTDAGILSRQYKTRQGGTGLIPEDRFYNLIAKAEGSRRIREVILRSTSQGLRAWFYDECAKAQGTVLTDEQTDKILASFAGKGVSLEQLEAYLGRKKSMGWQIADRKRLIAIWTALDTGEATIAELFNGDTGSPEGSTPPPKKKPKDLDDLAGDEPRPTDAKPTQHMLDRMSERGITMDQVRGAIAQGPYIEMPGGERRYSHQGVTACVKDGTIITTWKGHPQKEPEDAGGPQTPAEADRGPSTPPQTPEGDPGDPPQPDGGSDDQVQAVMAKVAADIKKRRNPQIVHDNRGKWIEQLVVAGMNQATAEAKVQDLATERIQHLEALKAEKEEEQPEQPPTPPPAEPPTPTAGPPQGGPNPMEPSQAEEDARRDVDMGPADPADSPEPGSLDDLADDDDAGGLF